MKYAIAAGHEATARAAEEMLLQGGNAADAAIAAAFASWVAEPLMTSAGGGGFAAVHLPDGQQAFLDFFVQTPQKKRPGQEVDIRPLQVNFGDTTETFYIGAGTTAVPGFIDGLFTLHHRYASLPMQELVRPACELARQGVRLNPFQIYCIGLLDQMLSQSETGRSLFYRQKQILNPEQPLRMSRMCNFFDNLAREGRDFFYLGEPAQKLVQLQRENGGQIRLQDMAGYRSRTHHPLHLQHRGLNITTFPPPNMGGPLLALLLHRMHHRPPPPQPSHSPAHARWLFEALRGISRLKHDRQALYQALQNTSLWGNTTHISILDHQGMAISLTSSNGEGCGLFIPDTDIQLNNMMGEPALQPEGLHSWKKNERLPSMMCPTLVCLPSGKLHSALGSAGAGRIPFAIAQVLHFMLDYPTPLVKAVNAARTYLHRGLFELEKGFEMVHPDDFPEVNLRPWSKKSLYFGGVNAVAVENQRFIAAADARREGVALFANLN